MEAWQDHFCRILPAPLPTGDIDRTASQRSTATIQNDTKGTRNKTKKNQRKNLHDTSPQGSPRMTIIQAAEEMVSAHCNVFQGLSRWFVFIRFSIRLVFAS